MKIDCWIHCWGCADVREGDALARELCKHGISPSVFDHGAPSGAGICLFGQATSEFRDFLQTVSRGGHERTIAVATSPGNANGLSNLDLLASGASDVLAWSTPERVARQIFSRFERWLAVDALMESPAVAGFCVGRSAVWRAILREIVEVARFSGAPALILGESGTGKEVIAQLIHQLDSRPQKRDLVILDCSTIVSGLSGSEFFGHERGAFTGAMSEREGAFSLANGGTLFLDEIGELPLPMQAQLLRVIQERTYKRVGGNTWRKTDFRLICATNRDLADMVRKGEFRADLYYRIASFVCKLPPLRERIEDVIPLAEHFLRKIHPDGETPGLDHCVRDYLQCREYVGNVRDLQQVVCRLMYRYAGDGTITIGSVPPEERKVSDSENALWQDLHFKRVIHRAVLLGAGLKEIGRAAEELAIQIATAEENGNIQKAARRLGVTDRALQLRRANRRQAED